MFMGLKLEDRKPITEILQQTPEIPPSCQWCLFLRNHDELTLEMVTDVERDYMYDTYAESKTMRLNLGIRRRLAPLLDNDRRRIELMNGMLMSLPGTPIIYYGDEIGMGDNINLGDRNGVRTPMQWSGGTNGGFSTADPERLYAPLIQDPVYGYQAVNVLRQERANTCSSIGCEASYRFADRPGCSAGDRLSFCTQPTTESWHMCGGWEARRSWWSTIFRAPRKQSNWICGATREIFRSRCLVRICFRAWAICPIC